MKQTHILPQIPKGITDPVVEKYLRDMQKVIRDKHEDDYMSSKKGDVGADIIIKYEIEALITHWCLVDPTQLPAVFQVCDGSVWKSGSYAESFWSPRGLTKIPNLCGYGLRAADRSSTQNDPDRDDRRQAVTGEVLTGGLTVSLPNFYCNVIKEARDKGRTVQIGINTSDMFGTLSPVGTVSNVDLATNIVTVGTALTVGATSLIIRGDCIGSFQRDQFQSFRMTIYGETAGSVNGYYNGLTFAARNPGSKDGSARIGFSASEFYEEPNFGTPRTGAETRIKNISYLPIMYVLLPSQALVNINGEIRNIDALIDKIGANSYVSQIVQNHVIDPYDYAGGGTLASPRELTCLTTSITTVKKESKIAIDAHICMETIYNSVLELYRVVDGIETKIGSPQQAGSRYFGITILPYDGSQDSTMSNVEIQYIDTPSCDIGKVITYKIKIYGETGTGYFINRTLSDTDGGGYERATSNVRLTEFAGTPNINFGDTDVASVSEAKAGVDNTKVITPYGLRQALNAEGTAPVYACRAWVNFNGQTNAIRASGNVGSITDNAMNDYTINFVTPMEDVNFVCLSNSEGIIGTNNQWSGTLRLHGIKTINSVRLYESSLASEFVYCDVAVFR